MDVREILTISRGAMSAKVVFGEPFTKDGVTVIPAARVWGGAGGGHQQKSKSVPGGNGGGFGLRAKPAGAYVIRGQQVRWMPAVDVNQIVVGCQLLAVGLVLLLGRRHRHHRPAGPGPRGGRVVDNAVPAEVRPQGPGEVGGLLSAP
jgi:uncharacterized spore protein YtfJ